MTTAAMTTVSNHRLNQDVGTRRAVSTVAVRPLSSDKNSCFNAAYAYACADVTGQLARRVSEYRSPNAPPSAWFGAVEYERKANVRVRCPLRYRHCFEQVKPHDGKPLAAGSSPYITWRPNLQPAFSIDRHCGRDPPHHGSVGLAAAVCNPETWARGLNSQVPCAGMIRRARYIFS